MLVLLLLGTLAYIISKITKTDTSLDDLNRVIKETHIYSGVDEVTYKTFFGVNSDSERIQDTSQVFTTVSRKGAEKSQWSITHRRGYNEQPRRYITSYRVRV